MLVCSEPSRAGTNHRPQFTQTRPRKTTAPLLPPPTRPRVPAPHRTVVSRTTNNVLVLLPPPLQSAPPPPRLQHPSQPARRPQSTNTTTTYLLPRLLCSLDSSWTPDPDLNCLVDCRLLPGCSRLSNFSALDALVIVASHFFSRGSPLEIPFFRLAIPNWFRRLNPLTLSQAFGAFAVLYKHTSLGPDQSLRSAS